MRRSEHDPLRLNVAVLAAAGGSLAGTWPLASLGRLAAGAHADAPAAACDEVSWSVRGEHRKRSGAAPDIWLHLQARTVIPLQCQRCLAPVEEALRIDRWLRFVATEDAAAALDADSEDDVLELTRSLDLRELVEDEFLMSLPLVPRHERCPAPLVALLDPAAAKEPPPRENPFAVLQALKKPEAER
ncbi:YceD family protein [Methylibium sp.]|uniref:YceD family protein n=1 Tax=Methylibium sp. TaxID=2067992 RepID=UPI003D152EB3